MNICPDMIEMTEEGIAKLTVNEVPEDKEENIREASDSCPAEAIMIEE
ncbi:ferredoxin [candidate division WOR-3 bacterium]|nr:ferredoxin [candidate division WOR-3 bacterium]